MIRPLRQGSYVIRRSQSAASLAIALNRTSAQPLHWQVYHQLREIILGGRVTTGAALPSTRTLARELGVSRTTLALAFDQLHADGYIDGRAGSGTYVATPPIAPARAAALDRPPAVARPCPQCSALAQRFGDDVIPRDRYLRAFRPSLADTELFPHAVWRRLISKFWKRPPSGLLYSAPPAGYEPLRRAIADYVWVTRGVVCTPDQVIVTAGTQDGINLVARTLISRGDKVWVEDPGYPNTRYPLLAAGAELVPVAVDAHGISADLGKRKAPHARLALVTPSRQYPLGITMDLSRRLELLEWARDAGAWIVEDDYDAEFRYAGPPVSALQGLDKNGCVVYAGTFSKLMFRTLRLGYVIVPSRVLDSFLRVRFALDGQMPIALQPALAEFIDTGQFAKHVRRMRLLYAERQEILINEVNRALSDYLQAQPDDSGMHIVAKLRSRNGGRTDKDFSDLAFAAGISAPALSGFYLDKPRQDGLLLGYAGLRPEEIACGVDILRRRFSQCIR